MRLPTVLTIDGSAAIDDSRHQADGRRDWKRKRVTMSPTLTGSPLFS